MPIKTHLESTDVGSGSWTYVAVRRRGERYGRVVLRTTYSEEFARFYLAEQDFDEEEFETAVTRSPAEFGFRAPIDDDTYFAEPFCRSTASNFNFEEITMLHEDVRGLWELAELDGVSGIGENTNALVRDMHRMVSRMVELLDIERDQAEERLPSRNECWATLLYQAKRGRRKKASQSERTARKVVSTLLDSISDLDSLAADGIADVIRKIKVGKPSTIASLKRVTKLD